MYVIHVSKLPMYSAFCVCLYFCLILRSYFCLAADFANKDEYIVTIVC